MLSQRQNAEVEVQHAIRMGIVKDVGMALALFWLVVIAAMVVFEPAPLSYQNLPFPVVYDGPARPLAPGDGLTLNVARCDRLFGVFDWGAHALIYRNARTLVNDVTGERSVLDDATAAAEPGCAMVKSRLTTIPKDLPPGRYHVDAYAQVTGVVRSQTVHWYSQSFEVK